VTRVVMEAPADDWRPPFYLLEAQGFEVWLVNARDVKHLPGRPKTDRLDAVWLCVAVQGRRAADAAPKLCAPTADPPAPRPDPLPRRSGRGVPTAEKNRVEKLLEDAQIKLSVVASDIFGSRAGRCWPRWCRGARPKVLAQLARTRLRAKLGALHEAFVGRFSDHHAFLAQTILSRIDQASADIAAVEAKIEAEIAPFQAAADRLDEICGIGRAAAQVIIAELGVDMRRFPTPAIWPPGPAMPPGSRSRPARSKAKPPPGTATPTWPGSWARPPWPPWPLGGPTPSWASATGAWPNAAAPTRPSSRSAAPSCSSSGICSPTPSPLPRSGSRLLPDPHRR
jgi:transposase